MKKKVVLLIVGLIAGLLGVQRVYAKEEVHPVKNQLIIVNKSINKLAFYQDGELITILPVATGRTKELTPEGTFNVIHLYRNMPYYKKHIPGGAPNNPLGPRWIGLDVPGTKGFTYGIHGNNAPWSIGTNASSGCVRMYNSDVVWLYSKLEIGAKVVITRSKGNFDSIARNKGYLKVEEKAKPSSAQIQVRNRVAVYKRATKYYKRVGYVQPHTMKVTKKYKSWYYIQEGKVKGWIKDKSINELDTAKELYVYHMKQIEKNNPLVRKTNGYVHMLKEYGLGKLKSA